MTTATRQQELLNEQETVESLGIKLDRYRGTFHNLEANNADKRVIGSWKSRIKKLEAELEAKQGDLNRNPVNPEFESNEEETQMTTATKAPKAPKAPKASTKAAKSTGTPTDPTVNEKGKKGTLYCMCGCGNANNPGSKFSMGHDARLKSTLTKIDRGTLGGSAIPSTTVADFTANKELSVGPFTSADVIRLAKKAGPKAK